MATYEDISIDQGTDTTVKLELLNDDGSTKNLTNHQVRAKLKRTYSSTADSDIVSFSAQIPIPASDGIINLSLTNTQTDAMRTGRWVYDCEISFFDSDNNEIVERILEGKATVTPSVTK